MVIRLRQATNEYAPPLPVIDVDFIFILTKIWQSLVVFFCVTNATADYLFKAWKDDATEVH